MEFPSRNSVHVLLPPLRNFFPTSLPTLPCLHPPIHVSRYPASYFRQPRSSRNEPKHFSDHVYDRSAICPSNFVEWLPRAPQRAFQNFAGEQAHVSGETDYSCPSSKARLPFVAVSHSESRSTTRGLSTNDGDVEDRAPRRSESESEPNSSRSEISALSEHSTTIKKNNSKTPAKRKRNFACPYPNCNKVLSEKSNLKAHVRLHTKERPYKCKLGCGKTFMWKSSLNYHTNVVHGDRRPFRCQYCQKRFAERPKLRIHQDWCVSTCK